MRAKPWPSLVTTPKSMSVQVERASEPVIHFENSFRKSSARIATQSSFFRNLSAQYLGRALLCKGIVNKKTGRTDQNQSYLIKHSFDSALHETTKMKTSTKLSLSLSHLPVWGHEEPKSDGLK